MIILLIIINSNINIILYLNIVDNLNLNNINKNLRSKYNEFNLFIFMNF